MITRGGIMITRGGYSNILMLTRVGYSNDYEGRVL